MAARANCANLFCFTWVVSSFTELLLSVVQNINLDQNALTALILLYLRGQFFTELLLSVEQNIK